MNMNNMYYNGQFYENAPILRNRILTPPNLPLTTRVAPMTTHICNTHLGPPPLPQVDHTCSHVSYVIV